MTDPAYPSEESRIGPIGRARSRAKRLFGPTLGVFGLDTDGHLLPASDEVGRSVEARSQMVAEKDDRARMAIAEAEIETERREEQQTRSYLRPNG